MLKQMEELLQRSGRGQGDAERDDDVTVRARTAAAESGVERLVDDDLDKRNVPMTTGFALRYQLRPVLR